MLSPPVNANLFVHTSALLFGGKKENGETEFVHLFASVERYEQKLSCFMQALLHHDSISVTVSMLSAPTSFSGWHETVKKMCTETILALELSRPPRCISDAKCTLTGQAPKRCIQIW